MTDVRLLFIPLLAAVWPVMVSGHNPSIGHWQRRLDPSAAVGADPWQHSAQPQRRLQGAAKSRAVACAQRWGGRPCVDLRMTMPSTAHLFATLC